MVKLITLEDVKRYLDRLKLKEVNEFQGEEYIPLDEYFMKICQHNSVLDIDMRQLTFNEYMDGKITFEEMLAEIEKEDNKN
ncbi:MAG: hypothetical protein K2G42_02785 [Clostridia bacterium]|nr:hypothetical protein [Clostridia bacterium]